jgi:hypothetical protein
MRVCVVCGSPLCHVRSDALHCEPSCRTMASQLKAILRGECPQGYGSIQQRVEASEKRTKTLSGALVKRESGGDPDE